MSASPASSCTGQDRRARSCPRRRCGGRGRICAVAPPPAPPPPERPATAIPRTVALALLRLSLPPELPVQPERGVVNASLQVDHDARRGTRLALDAGLSGIELRRPAHFVTAPSLRVTAAALPFGGGAVTV